tara:strand:- start:166 stop:711 length:546 start_codon:yes stop_codon:yes gene_type:complete
LNSTRTQNLASLSGDLRGCNGGEGEDQAGSKPSTPRHSPRGPTPNGSPGAAGASDAAPTTTETSAGGASGTPGTATSSSSGISPKTRIVREILETEREYVQRLKIVVEYFLDPLEKDSQNPWGLVKPDHIKLLFSNVKILLKIGEELLKEVYIVKKKKKSIHLLSLHSSSPQISSFLCQCS